MANLAVGNSNATSAAAQNAAAIAAARAAEQQKFGGQLIGTGLGLASNYFKPAATSYGYTAPGAPSYYGGGTVGNFGF